MAEISDGSTVAPNPSVEALIKAELARFARRQLFVQVAVQLVVQAAAYGSMAFFLYRIHRTVQQGCRRAPERPARDAGLAAAGPRLLRSSTTTGGRDSPSCEAGGGRRVMRSRLSGSAGGVGIGVPVVSPSSPAACGAGGSRGAAWRRRPCSAR